MLASGALTRAWRLGDGVDPALAAAAYELRPNTLGKPTKGQADFG